MNKDNNLPISFQDLLDSFSKVLQNPKPKFQEIKATPMQSQPKSPIDIIKDLSTQALGGVRKGVDTALGSMTSYIKDIPSNIQKNQEALKTGLSENATPEQRKQAIAMGANMVAGISSESGAVKPISKSLIERFYSRGDTLVTKTGASTVKDTLKLGAVVGEGTAIIGLGNSKNHIEASNPPQKSVTSPSSLAQAIANSETGTVPEGKKYSFSQPSGVKSLGRALGKYQVTEGELKTYSERYLGKKVSLKQFLSSPKLQDKYMIGKIEYLRKQGYADEEIIGSHRGGLNADISSSTIKAYIDKTKSNIK